MKFYNREKELKNLKEIEKISKVSSKMTVIVGRRRIGKTKLIQEAYKEKIYLFVSKCSHASTWPPARINTWPVEKVKNILGAL